MKNAVRVVADDEVIKLAWVCQCYVGPSTWKGTEIYEPEECNTPFETEDIGENWNTKTCSASCPVCDAELTQKYDDPELL